MRGMSNSTQKLCCFTNLKRFSIASSSNVCAISLRRRPISSSEIEIEEKSPPFETPGMDLSEDTEKINVVYLDDDEIEVPEESSQPGLTEKDVLLAVTTLSFDIAVLELFLPIIIGARVVIVSSETAIVIIIVRMVKEKDDLSRC